MLFLFILLIVLTALAAEWAARKADMVLKAARTLQLIAVLGAGSVAVLVVPRAVLIAGTVGVLMLVAYRIRWRRLMAIDDARDLWGLGCFLVAYLILLGLVQYDYVLARCVGIVGLCYTAGFGVEKLCGGRAYYLHGERKNWWGSLAFGGVFLLAVLVLGTMDYRSLSEENWLEASSWSLNAYQCSVALVGAVVLATAEALGSRGFDKLFVPLLVYAIWPGVAQPVGSGYPWVQVLFLPATGLFVWWAVRRGSLTVEGGLTAGVLAYGVVNSVGPEWMIPLFVFFGSSTVIGKLLPSRTAAGDSKHALARDATQVLVNGGLYTFIAVFGSEFLSGGPGPGTGYLPSAPEPPAYTYALSLFSVMAIATSDTWSSEVGQYFQGPTYDIITFRPAPPGLSGGISLAGTVAGLGGSLLIAITGVLMRPEIGWPGLFQISLTGFAGMLFDSVLGSRLQATYQHAGTGQLSDTPGPQTHLYRGWPAMTNDAVNALSIFLGWLLFLALNYLIN